MTRNVVWRASSFHVLLLELGWANVQIEHHCIILQERIKKM